MSMESVTAFPLHWPSHRPRTKYRTRARFHRQTQQRDAAGTVWTNKASLTIAESRDRLFHELELLGASAVIISSNLRLKLDGTPMGMQSNPADPGVAVYFKIKALPHALSCDKWDRASDNLAAIAKYVEAMRGQIRWGVGDVASMFAGFKALPGAIVTPAAMSFDDAAQFLREWSGEAVNAENLDAAYRAAVKRLHPDAAPTRTAEWQQLQAAIAVLRRELKQEASIA